MEYDDYSLGGESSWLDDIGKVVDSWFSDDPVQQESFMTPEYQDIAPQQEQALLEFESVLDTSPDSWSDHYDKFFVDSGYSAEGAVDTDVSDSDLMDEILGFAKSDKGSSLIGGVLTAGAGYFMQQDQQKYLEEQARLAHERNLEMAALRSSGGGASKPPPGTTERVDTSKLSERLVRR